MTELLNLYPEELREWLQARGEAAATLSSLFIPSKKTSSASARLTVIFIKNYSTRA